jgi:alpha-tubulin suppressor-like RCC1 family protein
VTVTPVKTVVAGNNLTLALKATGGTYVWGENTWGQTANGNLSTPQSSPLALAGAATWKSVATGGYHSLGIKSDGTLWAWGLDDKGQLGNATSGNFSTGQPKFFPTPQAIGVAKDWLVVSAGDGHSVGIKGTTTPVLMAWGQNTSGQLGLGNTNPVNQPTQIVVVVPASKPLWTSLACSGSYSLALRSDGVVFAWGDNANGQLGQLGGGNLNVPTAITLLTVQVVSIAAGTNHAAAIGQDNTLWMWGSNAGGQLGLGPSGTPTVYPFPAQLGTDLWVAVACGGAHTLAIRLTDQTLWAWGSNADGQLGDGTTTDSLAPKQIGTGRWVAVAAGKSHSMAIATDGTLWAWGRNAEGQLGNGSTAALLVPTQIP